MSGVVETGSTRPRPLSGGFWTLLSWLRGDEHSASSDSISSVGSDRTAVSFAFLAPAHYHAGTAPLVLPPPGPPTDSYKKRVHERNLRRQYDRDLTLHRKYGLFRGGVNFDANSLPPARRAGTVSDRKDRERRAASECLQRRTAHVPGKRRAPPPPRTPSPSNVAVPSSSTNRRHTRKRPAPKPPVQTIGRPNENIRFSGNYKIDMNSSSSPDTQPLSSLALNSKPKKCNKKDSDFKDTKARSEKSFLKQIFENKKKNASADTSLIKILPSISELDKQAAEIIETSRSKKQNQFKEQNMIINSTENVWYCFKCSKRYDNGVNYCLLCKILKDTSTSAFKENRRNTTIYTQTEDASPSPSTSKNREIEEKQKLKEMLKEMKDSLPKRTKLDNVAENHKSHDKKIVNTVQTKKKILESETPTLPIGTNIAKNDNPVNEQRFNRETSQSEKNAVKFNNNNIIISRIDEKQGNFAKMQKTHKSTHVKESQDERKLLNTPLRISSLLNPIYIPKPNSLVQDQEVNISSPTKMAKNDLEKVNPITTDQIYVKTADAVREILLNAAVSSSPKASSHVTKSKLIKEKTNPTHLINEQSTSGIASSQTSKNTNEKDNNIQRLNNHSRRRDLVNQLEKSIASGDERAAAEAAMKLAQLRLSCSVLSFTSQILQQPLIKKNNETIAVNDDANSKSTGIEPNSKLLGNNKKPSKGHDTHDASTSTNNVLIKKYTHALSEPTVKGNEVDNQSLKIEEFPSKSTNRVTPNTSITITSSDAKSISSKGLNTENKQNKKCDQEASRLESLAQPSTSMEKETDDGTTKSIAVWIEDKEKAHGPIRLQIPRNADMGGLRRHAERALGLPLRLQRWIVGKELCNDDETTLVSLAGPDLNIPFYLCVVECDKSVQVHIRTLCEVNSETTNDKSNNGSEENTSSGVYKELVNLERQATVPNAEAFECEICMEHCAAGDGVVLRECVHSFCRQCLSDVIRHCEEPAVSCPAMGCPGLLHEREIRALVNPQDYERWLNRGLAAAESGTRNAFHCRTRDCTGWALCEAGASRFPCPVCKHINCVQCQAIHEGETCDQYRTKLEQAAVKTSQTTDEGTQALIQSLISRGEALQCPECSAVITKKWGCDWVKCSACKTEICWVTRGRRWGRAGRGDTSGGCQCGVDGKRCHPSCGYCH